MKSTLLRDVVDGFHDRRVLVVGDSMLDEHVWGAVRRISPEAPVPVVEVERCNYVPGGAANTAVNAASLGGRVSLGGVVGADRDAERLTTALRAAGVDPGGLIPDPQRGTTTKTRIIAHGQHVARLDREHKAPLPAALEDRLLNWAEQEMETAEVCILSDYAKGVVSARFAQEFLSRARRAGRPVVVDPKGKDYAKYQGATVIKPNVQEVQQVLNREVRDEADWLHAGKQLTGMLPGTALLISRGAEGMSLFRGSEPPLHIPSVARAVFDVTGAGDTVVSTLALALAAGAPIEQAAHLANRAAGIVVGKVGTAAVSAEELRMRLTPRRRSQRTLAKAVNS
jgi:D-beta-D-heptose 7-phosphate kinase/D-beta-D-heptose 1-phosphate adenosyltransferase